MWPFKTRGEPAPSPPGAAPPGAAAPGAAAPGAESSLLAGRVALVTGASRGIGAAVAARLAANGASVAIGYRERESAAAAVRSTIDGLGGRAVLAAADLGDDRQTRRMLERVRGELGEVDVVVHCAWPGWKSGAADQVPWQDFEAFFDGMVGSAHRLIAGVVPGMRARRTGSVIFLGTTSMYELNPGHAAYATAKGALLALTRSLARDVGPDGVRVNMLSPGLVWTGAGPEPQDWGAEHVRRAALGRLPTAHEIAGVAVFLASDLAAAVTGAQISPSGGLVMHLG